MSKKNFIRNNFIGNKEENWVDDLLVRQKEDLKYEEDVLSSLPEKIKQKWHLEEDE